MKALTTLVFTSLLTVIGYGQPTLTLEECYKRAEANYPLIGQRHIIDQVGTLSVENVSRENLPQISVGGQATYQSDVTMIPIEMPGIEPLSKDQYRIFGEVSQTLYRGGLVTERRRAVDLNSQVEEKQLAVDLYQLRDRINELFFGILLFQEQATQRALLRVDLEAALGKVEAAIVHGTAIRSAGDALRAELLKVDQGIIEMRAAENIYRETLGRFIDQSVDGAVLQKPEFADAPAALQRPELDLIDIERKRIESSQALVSAGKKPRVDLFVQGGYGRPGLNMLENRFDFYYLAGIRFSWLLSGYYTWKRENEIMALRQRSLDVKKGTFLFNSGLVLSQHQAEISKLRRLIAVDDEIIALRTAIRKTAAAQLEEGVITSADFIREVNAEDQAKQNRALHETQLLVAQAKYNFTSGQY